MDCYKKRNLQGVPKKVADRNFEGCVWKSGFRPKWPGLTQMVVVQKFTKLTRAYKFWWQLFMGHPVNLIKLEGGAVPGVHRGVQHPRARPDQVEGEAV